MHNMAFWKWWSTVISIGALFLIAEAYAGISTYLFETDTTGLSLVIVSIFALFMLVAGYFSYISQFYGTQITKKATNPLWFASDTVLGIGMVGTLIGFLMVLTNAFQNIDSTNALEIKRIIGVLAHGMGVALITTLTGLICSIMMKFQLVMFESDNEKL